MQVNQDSIDEFLKNVDVEPSFLYDYGNGILLNDNHIEVLNRNGFDYKKYNSLNALLFDIEESLNNGLSDDEALELVAEELSEYNYYQNTKK